MIIGVHFDCPSFRRHRYGNISISYYDDDILIITNNTSIYLYFVQYLFDILAVISSSLILYTELELIQDCIRR